jgi:hypothetical protein
MIAAREFVKVLALVGASTQKQWLNSLYLLRPLSASKVNYVVEDAR